MVDKISHFWQIPPGRVPPSNRLFTLSRVVDQERLDLSRASLHAERHETRRGCRLKRSSEIGKNFSFIIFKEIEG